MAQPGAARVVQVAVEVADPHRVEREAGLRGELPGRIAPCLAVLAGSALQGGVHLKKFRLEFEHFNLLGGIKRLFGMQALWGGVKALLTHLAKLAQAA